MRACRRRRDRQGQRHLRQHRIRREPLGHGVRDRVRQPHRCQRSGDRVLRNGDDGVRLSGTSSAATSAARSAGQGNVIGGNTGRRRITGADSSYNKVMGNLIGVARRGTDLGNGAYGVAIGDGHHNEIGGTDAGEKNVIAGNDSTGVNITTRTSTPWRATTSASADAGSAEPRRRRRLARGSIHNSIARNTIRDNTANGIGVHSAGDDRNTFTAQHHLREPRGRHQP